MLFNNTAATVVANCTCYDVISSLSVRACGTSFIRFALACRPHEGKLDLE